MKKYNLSTIMKRAWEIVKKTWKCIRTGVAHELADCKSRVETEIR